MSSSGQVRRSIGYEPRTGGAMGKLKTDIKTKTKIKSGSIFSRVLMASAIVVAASLSVPGTALAEDSTTTSETPTLSGPPAQTVTQAPTNPAAPTSKVFGTLDLRAEYWGAPGAWDTSNFFQIGYQVNPNFLISWYQGFDSNIYKATLTQIPNASGWNPVWDQGFLRTRVNNIWKSGNLSFAYESRIYAPTWAFDSNMGNVTRFYNAFKLIDKVSDMVTLTGVFVFSPQVYNVAGTSYGGPNSWLENRLYAVADFQFTPKLSLSIPLLLYQDKYRDYTANPVNILLGGSSGDWGYFLYIWPELDYAVNDTMTLGLAYISGNMVQPNFSGFTIGNAFKTGILQFVVTTNL